MKFMSLDMQVTNAIDFLDQKWPEGAPTDRHVVQQGFNWSIGQWRKRWPDDLELPEQIRDATSTRGYVNRQDVLSRGQIMETEADAVSLFLLMGAWGTGTSARAISRLAQVLHQDGFPKKLMNARNAALQSGAVEAYRRLRKGAEDYIQQLGPAFFTKWLYFSCYENWNLQLGPAPLILDKNVALSLGWSEWGWSSSDYGDYLNLTTALRDSWAPLEPTHVVEYALFQAQRKS